MLDKKLEGTADECTSIYQDFSNDIKLALESARKDLEKYERLALVFPASTYHSDEIKKGFQSFCKEAGFAYKIIDSFEYDKHLREAFIVLEESDLISLLNLVRDRRLILGKDIGVVSYNETPLKEFIAGGLSVVSTDFAAMSTQAGKLLKSGTIVQLPNPFRYIKRGSL
jgi:DNA-binding LacI/PurR family transcriptional regulator